MYQHKYTKTLMMALMVMLAITITLFAPTNPNTVQANTSPTILSFTSSITEVTVDEAESGEVQTVLSWQTVNVSVTQQLRLEAYKLNEWVDITPEEGLPPNGDVEIAIDHTITFNPPTYRLLIVNSQDTDQILDQYYLTIPYAVTEGEGGMADPTIQYFSSILTTIGINNLRQGTAQIDVEWAVENRTPTTNLVFEQVLPDGQVVDVELPRNNLWIPSMGTGAVAPVFVEDITNVDLQMRVIDLTTNITLAQSSLSLAVIEGDSVVNPTPTPSATPSNNGSGATLRINSFTASPSFVDRGATVTLSWDVENATQVFISRLNPVGQITEEYSGLSTQGSLDVELAEYYVDSVMFTLYVRDANDNSLRADARVDINCPYTYFFEPSPEQAAQYGCPVDEGKDMFAAYQAFENGFMFWSSDTGMIYAMYNYGRFDRFEDTWEEGEELPAVSSTPPEDLLQPERGFGKVWAQNSSVREQLGWALAPEVGYTTYIQSSGAFRYASTFFYHPDQIQVIQTVENTWKFVDY